MEGGQFSELWGSCQRGKRQWILGAWDDLTRHTRSASAGALAKRYGKCSHLPAGTEYRESWREAGAQDRPKRNGARLGKKRHAEACPTGANPRASRLTQVTRVDARLGQVVVVWLCCLGLITEEAGKGSCRRRFWPGGARGGGQSFVEIFKRLDGGF